MGLPRDVFLIKEQDELPKLVSVLTEQSISTHLKPNKKPKSKAETLLSWNHLTTVDLANETGSTRLQKFKYQRRGYNRYRLHVQHLGQPAPAVVQTVRRRLKYI